MKLFKRTLALVVLVAAGAHGQTSLALAKKAEIFNADLQERFSLDGQILCKLKPPTESRPFVAYNMPDNAYMTGMYLGAMSLRYAATADPEAKAQALQSLDALHLLCNVSGVPGLLARAAWPVEKPFDDDGVWRPSPDGEHKWRGDVSSDQVDGVMFGFALAYELVANDSQKRRIGKNVAAIADHIVENNLRIVGFDGNPTEWGKYYPEYVREYEPMNALLLLQLLKVAAYTANDKRFESLYRQYASDEGYAEIATRARPLRDPERVNHSDDVLIFLGYLPLLRYETDPQLLRIYRQSLSRAWNGNEDWPGVAPERNPLYDFIARRYLGQTVDLAGAMQTLERFPLDMKWFPETIAAYEQRFDFTFVPSVQSEPPAPGEPVPVDRRVRSWSALVMNPYTTAGDRSQPHPLEYNGHDYLLPYWLGRYYGYIPANQ